MGRWPMLVCCRALGARTATITRPDGVQRSTITTPVGPCWYGAAPLALVPRLLRGPMASKGQPLRHPLAHAGMLPRPWRSYRYYYEARWRPKVNHYDTRWPMRVCSRALGARTATITRPDGAQRSTITTPVGPCGYVPAPLALRGTNSAAPYPPRPKAWVKAVFFFTGLKVPNVSSRYFRVRPKIYSLFRKLHGANGGR